MIYRTDLFEAAGVEVPTTIEEMIAASATLIEANADVPNFSGFYLPGRNWHAALSFIWDAGGDIAVQENGQWVGQLSSPESIAGLRRSSRSSTPATAPRSTATTPTTTWRSAPARSA